MAAYDGTAEFVVVSSEKLGQTVVWKGTALPAGAANKVPQYGFFQLVDSLTAPTTSKLYIQTSATISSPSFVRVPENSATGTQIYGSMSVTIGDYSVPSAAQSSVGASSVAAMGAATFSDTFGSDTWTDTDTDIEVNTGNTQIEITLSTDGTEAGTRKDMTGAIISNTVWTLRFPLEDFGTSNAETTSSDIVHIGIGSAASNSYAGSEDFIGIELNRTGLGTAKTFNIGWVAIDGAVHSGGTQIIAAQDIDTRIFVEVMRTSSTTMEVNVFSDSDYTIPIYLSGAKTIAATIQNLRYAKVIAKSVTDASATFNVSIENWYLYNSVNHGHYYPTYLWDANNSTEWRSYSVANPNCYIDLGSAKEVSSIALNINKTATTETEIKIRASTDTTFTDGETIRTISISDFTDDTWRFIILPRLTDDRRYIQIYGTTASTVILAINEIKYYSPTTAQWDRYHKHYSLITTDNTLDSN